MKFLKWMAIFIGVFMIVIQFIERPIISNPFTNENEVLSASIHVPTEVDAILRRSCFDCHSNLTEWPWYSRIAPISWYIVKDVNKGRKKLSFSKWGTYSTERAANKLNEICEEVEKGDMPLKEYVYLHPSAALTQKDKDILCQWVNEEHSKILSAHQ